MNVGDLLADRVLHRTRWYKFSFASSHLVDTHCSMLLHCKLCAVRLRMHALAVRAKSFRMRQKWGEKQLFERGSPTAIALENFDFFYRPVFKRRWPSIRLALLSDQKYFALVNHYGNTDRVVSELERLGCFNVLNSVREYQQSLNNPIPLPTSAPLITNQSKSSNKLKKDHEQATAVNAEFMSKNAVDPEQDLTAPANVRDESSLLDFVPAKSKPLEYYLPHEPRTGRDEGREEEYWAMKADEEAQKPVVNLEVTPDEVITLPEHLIAMTFARGDITIFSPPPPDRSGVVNYFLMDGASLFPVLALNVRTDDKILDMCASPGGKSLSMIQTLLRVDLLCNDDNEERVGKLRVTLESFIPEGAAVRDRIILRRHDATVMHGEDVAAYDKVLVDAPCTSDRISLQSDERSNLFRRSRMKERLELPQVQIDLLVNGLKSLKPGGSLVYATCTFASVQNDMVIEGALKRIWQETDLKVAIRDLSPLATSFQKAGIFRFWRGCKYGQLIVPFLPLNYGPMYVCKMQRLK